MKKINIGLKILMVILALFIAQPSFSALTNPYDTATPSGSDAPTAGDDRIREFKSAVVERCGQDHYWPATGTVYDDDDTGLHSKVSLLEQADLGTGAVGKTLLGSQTVGGKGELFYTDEDDNDVQITDGGSLVSTASGDVTAAAVMTDNSIIKGDGGAKGVQDTTILIDDSDNMTDVTSIEVDGAAASPPAVNTLYKDNIMRGYVVFAGSTGGTYDSFNVTSVTRNGVGDYTVTWNTDFATAYYAVSPHAMKVANHLVCVNNAALPTAGTYRFETVSLGGAAVDPTIVTVMAIGAQ